MDTQDFFKILCTYTPEELNAYIASKGKSKIVNIMTFIEEAPQYKQNHINKKENDPQCITSKK